MGNIVVAEDDTKQAELIRMYLERDGHTVRLVGDGEQAVGAVQDERPDLVVLDIMMPIMDGLDVCQIIREERDVPVIFVTARSTEADVLTGLKLGADDYMTKPFSPRELAARVNIILRRTAAAGSESDAHVVSCGGVEVDTRTHSVLVDGRPVECTPKEFALLEALIRERGRVMSRSQLVERAFGYDYDGLERTVDVHVASLRKKLEVDHRNPKRLITVFGVGYRFSTGADAV